MKTSRTLLSIALLTGAVAVAGSALADRTNGRGPAGVIYVESQGLFYDTYGTADLPPHGPFQELRMNAPGGGPSTAYGPGDVGYLGGRWWVDVNGNGEMDAGDAYFMCPLLGPGRTEP